MNPYLSLSIKRYLLILFILSFSCILLSPDFKINEMIESASSIFFYRSNIFSIFALLFATITTIQTYEKQNTNIAISMSGTHSLRVMRPVFFFTLAATLGNLMINQFFLVNAYNRLNKGIYLSSHEKKLVVKSNPEETIFYQNDLTNFTYIDKEKNMIYAKSAIKQPDGFLLFYADHFKRIDSSYSLVKSDKTYQLVTSAELLKEEGMTNTNQSLTDLFKAIKLSPNNHLLVSTLAYRLCMPLLNIFAFFLATFFGFSSTFRKRPYLCLSILSLVALLCFYILECSFILSSGNLLPPYYFILFGGILFTFTPIFSYAKKV
jgi:lipopolysaccharide export LptBFGC system permease protein LptF